MELKRGKDLTEKERLTYIAKYGLPDSFMPDADMLFVSEVDRVDRIFTFEPAIYILVEQINELNEWNKALEERILYLEEKLRIY